MKKIIALTGISLLSLFAAPAYSQTIEEALQQANNAFDSAKTYTQRMMAVNQFKLIASKWQDNWVANFYAAFSLGVASFQEPHKDNKDPMLDEADKYYAKIANMDSTNDEVNVLGALLAQARLSVNPMSRHGKYGEIVNKYLAKAASINPNNPRIYYLKGNTFFYTPALFGGGVNKAQPLYQKADSLFAFDSKDIMKPHWGKAVDESQLKLCKEKTGK